MSNTLSIATAIHALRAEHDTRWSAHVATWQAQFDTLTAARTAANATLQAELDAAIAPLVTAYRLALEEDRAAVQAQQLAEAANARRVLAAALRSPATGTATTGSPLAGRRLAPKYRNPATGQTWAGRGMQPLWLKLAADPTAYLLTGGDAVPQNSFSDPASETPAVGG